MTTPKPSLNWITEKETEIERLWNGMDAESKADFMKRVESMPTLAVFLQPALPREAQESMNQSRK